ncbi:MAG: S26 family signal peptidase [Paenibacillus sp.]|nr:S26 family signal peptidase [Paenibacillus sp.]
MRPAFDRGDLLFLSLPKNDPVEINDICVFKLPGRDIPIVHRVLKIRKEYIYMYIYISKTTSLFILFIYFSINTEKEYILTKGDNNTLDDRSLYGSGQMWIHKENIVGKVKG